MGYAVESCALDVTVSLDAHGGQREREHGVLWDEMCERLRSAVLPIVEDPRYAELRPYTSVVAG